MAWQLPDDFGEQIRVLDSIAIALRRRGNYSDAILIQNARYKLILERQTREGRRFHKGSPLWQIGICMLARGQPIPALPVFLCSFVEDCLSEEDQERPKALGAYSILARSYAMPSNFLSELQRFAVRKREEEDLDPMLILNQFVSSINIDDSSLMSLPQAEPRIITRQLSMDEIPGNREQRVFVGGSFGNYVTIQMLENIVIEVGYMPIIADRFVLREGSNDKTHAFELLENCAHAVFEISVPNGWQAEVEHADSKNIPLMCFHQGEKPSRYVSTMAKGYPHKGWRTFDDLKDSVADFVRGGTTHEGED